MFSMNWLYYIPIKHICQLYFIGFFIFSFLLFFLLGCSWTFCRFSDYAGFPAEPLIHLSFSQRFWDCDCSRRSATVTPSTYSLVTFQSPSQNGSVVHWDALSHWFGSSSRQAIGAILPSVVRSTSPRCTLSDSLPVCIHRCFPDNCGHILLLSEAAWSVPDISA